MDSVATAGASLAASGAACASLTPIAVGHGIDRDLRLCRLRLRHEQLGMLELDRLHLVARDDHPHAELGGRPELLREVMGQADAAMRRRVTRHHALVHRDARPGDALHERHRCAAVDVGVVVAVLLDDAEHALRGRVAGHAGRDRPLCDPDAIGVERHLLGADVDDDLLRALRDLAEAQILLDLGLFGLGRPFPAGGTCRADPARLQTHRRGVKAGVVAAIAELRLGGARQADKNHQKPRPKSAPYAGRQYQPDQMRRGSPPRISPRHFSRWFADVRRQANSERANSPTE